MCPTAARRSPIRSSSTAANTTIPDVLAVVSTSDDLRTSQLACLIFRVYTDVAGDRQSGRATTDAKPALPECPQRSGRCAARSPGIAAHMLGSSGCYPRRQAREGQTYPAAAACNSVLIDVPAAVAPPTFSDVAFRRSGQFPRYESSSGNYIYRRVSLIVGGDSTLPKIEYKTMKVDKTVDKMLLQKNRETRQTERLLPC